MKFWRSQPDEASLLQRAAARPEHRSLHQLTAGALEEITRREGVDFATALLFERLRTGREHCGFIREIDALRAAPLQRPKTRDLTIAIVPGALYQERPDLGGDGRLIREVARQLGWRAELVPTASRGAVSENARRINTWLAERADQKFILVSLSKGGSDLKFALRMAPDAFQNALAWVNVCGPLNGSPMADWILASRLRTWLLQMQYRWTRRDFRFIAELRRVNGPLAGPLQPPASMRLIHLAGFPLRRHLTSRFSKFCHRQLSVLGPNDGTTPHSDLLGWPGNIYPVWGADHYFRPESMASELIKAVLLWLADDLFSKRRGEALFTKVSPDNRPAPPVHECFQ